MGPQVPVYTCCPVKNNVPPFSLPSLDKKLHGHSFCHSLMAMMGRNVFDFLAGYLIASFIPYTISSLQDDIWVP